MKTKNFAKSFLPVHKGPVWSFFDKKSVENLVKREREGGGSDVKAVAKFKVRLSVE